MFAHIPHGVLSIYPLNLVNWQPGRQVACFQIIFLFESKVLNTVSPLIQGFFFFLTYS